MEIEEKMEPTAVDVGSLREYSKLELVEWVVENLEELGLAIEEVVGRLELLVDALRCLGG